MILKKTDVTHSHLNIAHSHWMLPNTPSFILLSMNNQILPISLKYPSPDITHKITDITLTHSDITHKDPSIPYVHSHAQLFCAVRLTFCLTFC